MLVAETLGCAGYWLGLYTSPHMHTVRERIRVGRTLIAETEVIARLDEHGRTVGQPDRTHDVRSVDRARADHFARAGAGHRRRRGRPRRPAGHDARRPERRQRPDPDRPRPPRRSSATRSARSHPTRWATSGQACPSSAHRRRRRHWRSSPLKPIASAARSRSSAATRRGPSGTAVRRRSDFVGPPAVRRRIPGATPRPTPYRRSRPSPMTVGPQANRFTSPPNSVWPDRTST